MMGVGGAANGFGAPVKPVEGSVRVFTGGRWQDADPAAFAEVVLARLLTVDGAGSGLDADLLDGNSSAYYRDADNIDAGTLAAARGGTGVSNTGTITCGSNVTITGGGTLALGGFTLTVPATGTVAVSAAALTDGRIPYATTGGLITDNAAFTFDGFRPVIIQTGVALLMKQGTSTSYTSQRWYNDIDSGARALEQGYTGSAYASAVLTGGIVGESGYLTTTGAYPLQLGTNNTARLTISSTGVVNVLNTTASTSTTTGSLINAGGLGNGGAITGGEAIRSVSATAGVGYATGAGGAVTQITSRTTGVTLNKVCGQITLVSAAGSAAWSSFTVTNSAIAATDVVRVCQVSGADKYQIHVTAVGAGSFEISFATTGGTTTEQPVFSFAVIKAVTA